MCLEAPILDYAALDIVLSATVKYPDTQCLTIFFLLIKHLSEFMKSSWEQDVKTPHSLEFTAQELRLQTFIL